MKEETIENEDDIVSLGKKLAELRLAQGLTESDVATQIRVRTSIIYDIENDNTANLPAVFYKGYIKNYAAIVGLPEIEYQSYIEARLSRPSIQVIRNYSNKEQAKRHTKRVLFISLLIIVMIVGVTAFLVWRDSKTSLVEVTHYVSPSTSMSG
ncbi:helix-turn-helix domain-containing protein [Orbus sturtevantii]|uniref:helix-turn-helix domain-containing protein n=1 Tax=Orbus sturtevantii TaxID=3074109 RepID=UPI00370D3B48